MGFRVQGLGFRVASLLLLLLLLGPQANFDVKWCRGTIGERILAPLVADIRKRGGTVLGSHPVKVE